MFDESFGIEIEHTTRTSADVENKILLHGKFNIPNNEDGPMAHGSEILKHIVLVVTRSGNYRAVTPFKKVIVFEPRILS